MTRPDLGSGRDVALNTENSRFNSDRSGFILREEDEERFQQFNENEEGLLATGSSTVYNAEDEEADRIFAFIDAKMSERRRKTTKKATTGVADSGNPSIQTMFADAKRDLQTVSLEEWADLPESGDFRAKRTKKANEKERYTPIPDSILLSGSGGGMSMDIAGEEEPDLTQIQEAKEQVLRVRLDQLTNFTQSVNPEAYLASMQASNKAQQQSSELGDIKRARTMLRSAVQTNPHSSQAWIAAIRLEEAALEPKTAKEMVRKACEMCPESEDVWLEALRLLPKEESLAIMSKALDSVPSSGKLWIGAAALEDDPTGKKRILQRGIERSHKSEILWKALIELEQGDVDAKALLEKAVECCPGSIDLWLALARLEDHEGARKVINRARAACPKNKEIWLAAARLEEAYDNFGLVEKIIVKAKADLSSIVPSEWLQLAAECLESEDKCTAQAIVSVIRDEIDLEEEAAKAPPSLAKLLYQVAIKADPTKSELLLKAIELDPADESLYESAIQACPTSEPVWLGWVKLKASQNDFVGAESILSQAHSHLPSSEALWLAAASIHLTAGNLGEARRIMTVARERLPSSEKVWRKAAKLERLAGDIDSCKSILLEGLQRGSSPKMWIMLAGIEEDPVRVRGIFESGLANCPHSDSLWIAAALHEESMASASDRTPAIARARALLEKGRLKLPKSETLWLESVRLEIRAAQPIMAKTLLAKALQSCPGSGSLWSEAVWMEPRPLRKGKATAALHQANAQDPTLLLTIAKLFWAERRLPQARDHFERAIKLDPANGDLWAFYIRFAQAYLGPSDAGLLLELAFRQEPPRAGQLWTAYRKAERLRFYTDPKGLFQAFIESLPDPA